MDDPIVEALKAILSPMGEKQASTVFGWMQQEARDRALVAYCWDGGNGIFELGKPSPINPDVIVFAMLHWEQQNCVVVFGAETKEVEQGTMVQYHRTLVFSPKHVAGPLSADALFNELESFMVAERDERAGANGAAPDDDDQEEGRQ